MGERTGIAWSGMITEDGKYIPGGTLNIGGGCTKKNEVCKNCYAMSVTAGLARKLPAGNRYEGLTHLVGDRAEWTNQVVTFPERLEKLVRKSAPKPWFISSLTDVFHVGYPDDFLIECFGAFVAAHTQRLYILTKRPDRQAEFLLSNKERILTEAKKWEGRVKGISVSSEWPARNIWCGSSAGNQKTLEELLPDLLRTTSVVQWLSLEPLIGPIDLKAALAPYAPEAYARLKWAVTGGESGDAARPMDLDWVRKIIADCRDLGVVPFFKQKGEVLARATNCPDKKGEVMEHWPEDVQVRSWPIVAN